MNPILPAPERRRSEGDAHALSEEDGWIDGHPDIRTGEDPNQANNAPPGLAKATIKPTGAPLATGQISGEIQEEAGNELVIHRLEEIEER